MNVNQRSKRKWYLPRIRFRDVFWIFVLTGVIALWYRDREQLKMELGGTAVPQSSWSVDQVIGPSDTVGPGDIQTAWASASQDGQTEWLILEFEQSDKVQSIHVHETYNPGALDQIDCVDWRGAETNIWKGVDPTPVGSGAGVSIIKLSTPVNTRRIKLYLDSKKVTGWNEIDSVAIVGVGGKKQYASKAWASSSFGDNHKKPSWFWP